jgi:hypothetical protein
MLLAMVHDLHLRKVGVAPERRGESPAVRPPVAEQGKRGGVIRVGAWILVGENVWRGIVSVPPVPPVPPLASPLYTRS